VIVSAETLPRSAEAFLKQFPEGGVFGLRGPLGVGKTTWVKAFVKILSQRTPGLESPRVVSPSFVIHQMYETNPRVEHFDFYRLELPSPESLIEIGFWEAVERAQADKGYVFVEWPEKTDLKLLALTAEIQLSFVEASHLREFQMILPPAKPLS